MAKKDYTEIIYVLSSFAMLLTFSIAFIYYILYKEILIYLVAFGFIAFVTGFIAKDRWERNIKKQGMRDG
ncbi:MAG: hypothetical protein R2747_12345 [Pyrinomonadaceae bacterium]